MKNSKNNKDWDIVIQSQKSFFKIDIQSLFSYRDLIYMFIKRDYVVFYKQTILGPIWYLIQPLVNTIVFTVIFGKVAKISTDGIPPFIFYMAGNVIWSYFSSCLSATSNIFVSNAGLFGKVYFPRLIVPISSIILSLLQFLIQFTFFLLFLGYFIFNGSDINISITALFLPFLLLQLAILSIGFGTLISSVTAKYRDLSFALPFLIQIWMFATPIVFPLSIVPDKYKLLASLNPMTSIIEIFRHMFLGVSSIDFNIIITSFLITIVALFLGIFNFSRVEKDFMDTV